MGSMSLHGTFQEESMRRIISNAPTPRDDSDLEYLRAALMSGESLAGNSDIVGQYEDKLKARFGTKHAVAVSSGTAAIHAGLHSLGVGRGDEVIVPVTAAVMSALPILELGATPVFADVSPNSFAISHHDVRRLITNKTKAVMSVPMWGYPGTTSDTVSLCNEMRLPLLTDAAQAIGTKVNGRPEGAWGSVGCFSTHELKMISTGEGGFVITNDDVVADSSRRFSRLGYVQGTSSKVQSGYGQEFGLNLKINSLAAALGLSQIEKLDNRLELRGRNHKEWLMRLAAHDDLIAPLYFGTTQTKPSHYASCFLIAPEIAEKLPAKQLAARLADNGISTDYDRYKYRLMSQYPVFEAAHSARNPKSDSHEFPNAVSMLKRLVVLPTHDSLKQDDFDYVSDTLVGILKKSPKAEFKKAGVEPRAPF